MFIRLISQEVKIKRAYKRALGYLNPDNKTSQTVAFTNEPIKGNIRYFLWN